ncbi:MAG: aldo/keto reductase, partial [Planctomycetota bacterium]
TIDLYYSHNDDYQTPLEETLEAYTGLIQAGKVRYIGASNYLAWRLARALTISEYKDISRYIAVQQRHTYLRPKPGFDWQHWPAATDEFLHCCKMNNLAVIAYSPLLGGAYVRDDKKVHKGQDWPDSEERMQALRSMADDIDATPNQLVLAWMLHSDPQVIPLFSASTKEQMDENLAALEIKLTDEQMSRLDEAGIA